MMKQRISIFLLFTLLLFANGYAQKGIMRLTQQTLMHEVRETPSPLDGQHIAVNPPRFMWPDKFPHLGPVLDGVEEEDHKPEVTYRIRIARDPEFKSEVMTAERNWAFFNPFKLFEKGIYFNISKNINEVKELGPGNADSISSGSVIKAYFITRVGEAIGCYYLPVL